MSYVVRVNGRYLHRGRLGRVTAATHYAHPSGACSAALAYLIKADLRYAAILKAVPERNGQPFGEFSLAKVGEARR